MIPSPALAQPPPPPPTPAAAEMRMLTLDKNVYASLTEALQIPDAPAPQSPPPASANPKSDPSALPPIENLRVIAWHEPLDTPIV